MSEATDLSSNSPPENSDRASGGANLSCDHSGPLEEMHIGFRYVLVLKCPRCGMADYRFYERQP